MFVLCTKTHVLCLVYMYMTSPVTKYLRKNMTVFNKNGMIINKYSCIMHLKRECFVFCVQLLRNRAIFI